MLCEYQYFSFICTLLFSFLFRHAYYKRLAGRISITSLAYGTTYLLVVALWSFSDIDWARVVARLGWVVGCWVATETVDPRDCEIEIPPIISVDFGLVKVFGVNLQGTYRFGQGFIRYN